MGKIGIGKALFGWGKATSTIKSVAPLSKTGGKSVKDWKTIARKAKLKAAVFDIKQSLGLTRKRLSEVQETLKKQKKILDD